MIRNVSANRPSFREVDFEPGFNVVLAERTEEATRRDSRNGLGKTFLVKIIHFCLGASTKPGKEPRVEALEGWSFSLDIDTPRGPLTVTREVDHPTQVTLDPGLDTLDGLSPTTEEALSQDQIHYTEWVSVLGELVFGIDPDLSNEKYTPTFRSCISYFIRSDTVAYTDPFKHYRHQYTWDKEVNNAFLLGLSWRDAREYQVLRDKKDFLDELLRKAESDYMEDILGPKAELEARVVRLDERLQRQEERIDSFSIHPEYEDLEEEANSLTEEIHERIDERQRTDRLLSLYRESLEEETPPSEEEVLEVYEEVGLHMPDSVSRRFEEVQEFHEQVVENRTSFLESEMNRLKRKHQQLSEDIEALSEERKEIMGILNSHGALDEYHRLQERHSQQVSKLEDLKRRLDTLEDVEDGKSKLAVERGELHQRARSNHRENSTQRREAIRAFNRFSEEMYREPGNLLIDVSERGFDFDIEIERAGSHGVESMKTLCYDLTLAHLWSNRDPSPQILVHDSPLFDGVDERQYATGLQLAAKEAEDKGYTYICLLNSDTLPDAEFSEEFEPRDHVRLELTDREPEGSLLGFRF